MGPIKTLIILQLVYLTSCMDQLHITYEWMQPEHAFDSPEQEESLKASGLNHDSYVPTSVAVHNATGRIFMAFPRMKSGVVASLNTLKIEDGTTSPKLVPYPSWDSHTKETPEIVSPFKIHIDRCDRLWVLDSGKMNLLEPNASSQLPPAILIYNLQTDSLITKYPIPEDQIKEDSWFANIAVEDIDCEKTYAYAADTGKAGVVVYSSEKNSSWRISHHYFHPDPLACEYGVKGLNFSWTNALFGMALSAPNEDSSTLYFHPMSSFYEFTVSTEYLRNQTIADENFDAFKMIGDRGPNAQSSASFIDPETGVLFYSLVNLNAVACWRTSNKEYTMKNQGRIYMNDSTMIYPADIKVYNGTVWILSNRLPIFMYGNLNPNEVNFRLFSAKVVDAISHTACDIKPRLDILDKFVKGVKNITKQVTSIGSNNAAGNLGPLSVSTIVLTWLFTMAVFN